jgi:hypothetical protein
VQKHVIGIFAVGAISLVTWLVAEGVVSIARLGNQGHSATFRAYSFAKTTLWRTVQENSQEGPKFTWLLNKGQIASLAATGIGLGNVPRNLVRHDTSDDQVNSREGGCPSQKPNLRKTMTYLRSNGRLWVEACDIYHQ